MAKQRRGLWGYYQKDDYIRKHLKMDKGILDKVLSGLYDKNIRFSDLRKLILSLGFDERVKGDQHIFIKDEVA